MIGHPDAGATELTNRILARDETLQDTVWGLWLEWAED